VGDRVELPDRPRATRGLKFFAAPKGQPRARRDPVWGFLGNSLWLWAALLVVAALARRRFAVVLVALATCLLAGFVALAAARAALGFWPDVGDSILGTSAGARFPHVRSAAAVAVIHAISPHLVGPLRKLSNWIVFVGTLGVAIAGGATLRAQTGPGNAPTPAFCALCSGASNLWRLRASITALEGAPSWGRGRADRRQPLGVLGVREPPTAARRAPPMRHTGTTQRQRWGDVAERSGG
jgi:hypothetical protein